MFGLSLALWAAATIARAADAEGKPLAGEASKTGEVTLVVSDEPAYIPNAAGLFDKRLTQSSAAERLAMLIERAAGIRPRIMPAAQTPQSGTRLFVGYGPHLEGKVTLPVKPEGLKIQEREGDLYLLGEVAPKGTNNWPGPVDRGLMHAVETYAEQVLGYRFLFSTTDDEKTFDLGTVIPKIAKLTIPPGLLIEEAPVFQHRVASTRPRNLMGLRSGSAPAFFCNHSYGMPWWSAAYGKTHPEMFLPKTPKKDAGADAAAKAMESQPNLSFLDYTEPLVLEKRLEQIRQFLEKGKAGGFYYNPTIKYLVEETPDTAAPTVQYNERSRALFDPKHHPWGNFSNIWFDYLSRMSGKVKERWPHMRISALAYMRHYGVPTFKLPDNIDVMLALMRTSMGNKEPEVFNANLADVKKWSEHLGGDRSRLFLWEYGCWPAFWKSTPVICPHAMQKWLQTVRPYVSGVFFEMYQPNEYYFLMRRLWMRLLWNPDLDVNGEIDDLCKHFFGPAGATMAEFYKLLIARYEMPWKNAKLTWGQYYLDNDLYFGQSYPPAVVDRLAGLLEKARREAGIAPGFAGNIISGAAVHVTNPDAAPAPLEFSVEALKDSLSVPTIVWEGGRYQLRERLMPGERLDIAADGSAKIVTAVGESRNATVSRDGEAPVLAAGKSQLIRFRKTGGNPEAEFRAVVRQGAGADAAPPEESIYAKRLIWMSKPHRILPPESSWGPDIANPIRKDTNTGFLAHARWYHQLKKLVPSYTEPAGAGFLTPDIAKADELAKAAQEALKRASKLKGAEQKEAREKEKAAAAQAFHEAMKIYPEWKIEDADQKNPWSVVGARVTRADIFCGIGEFEKGRAEYEEALKATSKQRDARSYVEMLIGDSYKQEENWVKAEEYYLRAQKTGLYGDRAKLVPQRLAEVKPLAERHRKQQPEKGGSSTPE